jgi:L-fuconolactonase
LIDAHQHFWRLGENDCTWPTADLPAIHRDFLPEDWRAVAVPCGVTGSVLVQTQESVRDTAWMLALAEQHDFILGVVGWADLTGSDFPQNPWLKGLRPMVQGYRANHLDSLDTGLAVMAEQGLVFDALVRPQHLASLERMALRHPALQIVIDHAAKPRFDDLGNWRKAMQRLAALPKVICKLSGLLTDAQGRDVAPLIAWLFDTFGEDRLLWGSDWPVLNLAGSYGGWLELAKSAIPETAHVAVFHDNARRIYSL